MSGAARDAEARARLLLRRVEELRAERPPTGPGDEDAWSLGLLAGSDVPPAGDEPPAALALRAVHASGHGPESAHLVEQEARLWVAGERLVRVVLRSAGTVVEDRTVKTGAEEDAWDRIEAFFVELLPPPLEPEPELPDVDAEGWVRRSHEVAADGKADRCRGCGRTFSKAPDHLHEGWHHAEEGWLCDRCYARLPEADGHSPDFRG